MFTKRHYKAIAQLIRNSRTLEDFVNKLVDFCKTDNERFSETRFRKALED